MTSLASAVIQWHDLRRRLLEAMPELADDEECLLDTLDGLSDMKEQMAALLRSALKEEAEAKGIDEYIKSLADRKASKVQRAKKKRALVSHFMQDAGLKTLSFADLTASLRAVPPSVNVYDESALPDEFWRVKREPNLADIKNALKAGATIPGCQLGNGSITLALKV